VDPRAPNAIAAIKFLAFRKPNKSFANANSKPENVQAVLLVTDNQHELPQTLRVPHASSEASIAPRSRQLEQTKSLLAVFNTIGLAQFQVADMIRAGATEQPHTSLPKVQANALTALVQNRRAGMAALQACIGSHNCMT